VIIFEVPSDSMLQALDPRTRVVSALVFALVVCFSTRPASLALALTAALLTACATRPNVRHLIGVLLAINGVLLLLTLSLGLAIPGEVLVHAGPLSITHEGLQRGITIACRANAIVVTITSLLGTVEPAHLGWALDRLRVPSAFVQILLFMVRYTEVIHTEYHRLRDAMALRCFRPRCNRHTLRTFGYLIGLLLVRSIDRSERILNAMKCRGFRGRLFLLQRFQCGRMDATFASAATVVLVSIILLEVL